ncbi:MAG: putative toxin-antitoxin system toxin component, PIN family [Gammaproteobacteria bacterium]|nr:putative toxin-antitoxin system toxin component, PIN family [Gammaproteobacteria bacterium]
MTSKSKIPLPHPVCRDLDDDVILATALAGDAGVIVTGDKDLTDLISHGWYQNPGTRRFPAVRRDLKKQPALRRFVSKNIPACLSFCPSSTLRQQLHRTTIRLLPRLEYEQNTPQSGIFFSGNRLSRGLTHEPRTNR